MNVTVTNHKGGCGKSTTAVHVAAYVAREFGEGSVVLVDTDPNGSAMEWAARGGGKGLPFRVVGPEEAAEEEHAVFDSQGRLHGEDLAAAAGLSDLLVVPTTPDFLSINALGRFLEDLEEVGGAPYRVLLTMVPWYERLHCPGRAELEGAGVPLFGRQVQERKVFRHAANEGVPVYGVRRRGAQSGWEDYKAVGRELVEVVGGEAR
jgi:chromosome partitioning protein